MKALDYTGLQRLIGDIKSRFIPKTDIVQATEISIDSTPTSGSNNLVKSGGVYNAVNNVLPQKVNDRYLHTDASGNLEWATVQQGGGTWGSITGTLSNQTDLQNALNAKYDASNPSGYTSNTGTITGITMNGSSKGTSGVVDLGTVITDVSGKIDKSIGTAAGDIIYYTASSTPSALPVGSNGQVLTLSSGLPAWVNAPTPTAYILGGDE